MFLGDMFLPPHNFENVCFAARYFGVSQPCLIFHVCAEKFALLDFFMQTEMGHALSFSTCSSAVLLLDFGKQGASTIPAPLLSMELSLA